MAVTSASRVETLRTPQVVKSGHLWPRSIATPPTDAEERAVASQAKKQQRRPDESVRVGFDGPRNRKGWSGKEPVGSPKAVLHFGCDHRPAEDYPPNGSRRRHSGPRRDGLVPHRRRPASQILGFRSEPRGTSLWLNGRDG